MNNGILNMGNTCYLNTSLQCLLNTNIFSEQLQTIQTNHQIFSSLRDIYENDKKLKQPIDLSSLLEILATQLKDKIYLREQNDMQEFIVIFIEALNKEISREINPKKMEQCISIRNNRNLSAIQRFRGHVEYEWLLSNKKEYSELISIFYGQQITQIQCNVCAGIYHLYENFMAIPLSFNANTNITELIHNFMLNEDVQSRDCDDCKKKCSAKKTHKFWRLPQVLMLFIKRFDSNLKKINNPIDVNETLDLSAYTMNKKNRQYSLVSIGCHCGSMNNGHYFAICRQPNNKWAIYDDDSIRYIDDYKSVASNLYYVLFYEII